MKLSNYEKNCNKETNFEERFLYRKLELQNRKRTLIMALFCIVCTIMTLLMFSTYKRSAQNYIDISEKYEKKISEYTELSNQYNVLYKEYEGIYSEYDQNLKYVEECESTINKLTELVNELDTQSKSLAKSNQEYFDLIQKYEKRSELFDKYEYSIIRTDGTRTDITYDQLINLEKVAEKKNIDTDLILSVTMVESNGCEKARSKVSTATGYGQFLVGTGKFVYEDLMKAGSYKHEYALNGKTNLTMMVNYIDYLEEIHDDDLYAVIRNYRGEGGSVLVNYINKIDNFLETKGKSVSKINSGIV